MMHKQKASILIFTLWVLVILAILSIIVSNRASTDIRLAKYEANKIKGIYLARAGIMKMLSELVKDNNGYDSISEDWNRDRTNPKELTLGNGKVRYGASDESGRLNLNGDNLKKNLTNLGIEPALVEAIAEYRSKKEFKFIEELFLIDGMTMDIYKGIKDFITIYRGLDSKVNINTANEQVLMAVLGDDSLVQEILGYRKDGEKIFTDENIAEAFSSFRIVSNQDITLFSVQSNFFRIWAEVYFTGEEGMIAGIEAVMDRTSAKIYHWKEY